jgi:large subunit ribosomal protein L23
MANKNPYQVIKHRHITEKATTLELLKDATSNPSISRFKLPKYVFVVDRSANKKEIALALEEIYKEKHVKVISVNTINVKSKPRRVRGRLGRTSAFKKAIVTFEKGDVLDDL